MKGKDAPFEVNNYDVLLMRADGKYDLTTEHVGNKRFEVLLSLHRASYTQALVSGPGADHQSDSIAAKIVNKVCHECVPNGRFLWKSSDSTQNKNAWEDLGDGPESRLIVHSMLVPVTVILSAESEQDEEPVTVDSSLPISARNSKSTINTTNGSRRPEKRFSIPGIFADLLKFRKTLDQHQDWDQEDMEPLPHTTDPNISLESMSGSVDERKKRRRRSSLLQRSLSESLRSSLSESLRSFGSSRRSFLGKKKSSKKSCGSIDFFDTTDDDILCHPNDEGGFTDATNAGNNRFRVIVNMNKPPYNAANKDGKDRIVSEIYTLVLKGTSHPGRFLIDIGNDEGTLDELSEEKSKARIKNELSKGESDDMKKLRSEAIQDLLQQKKKRDVVNRISRNSENNTSASSIELNFDDSVVRPVIPTSMTNADV
uniref:DUF6824 domain-containing protein n=1 Tax=Attheya septentrionalis TaxID=420275 RepID=A0A6T7JTE5_9STRA|mmetsp:Transcript_5699/g.10061  ORF Transcript_5699/g.10061 Transcript_5699/m.10061 type:complete len:427 (+) Transcript_5699:113-1393(+)